jgi:hypothetical protein
MSPRELWWKPTWEHCYEYGSLVQENRNDGGVLTDLDFVLQGREYEFHGKAFPKVGESRST